MNLPADIVSRVSRRLAEHAGLELPAWVVEARVTARIAALGCDPEAYATLIVAPRGERELTELVEAVRVGESSLFRHRQQITTLTDVVAPALRALGRRVVQVWSAGCSSGQEPYTLAVVLSRALPGVQISIVATDVSDDALEAARANTYPRDAIDDVPEEWRDAFIVDGEVARVRPEIAQLVRFERQNLVDPRRGDTETGRFDIVWCRNVLIYFSVDARRRAIERLIASTTVGGYVFVGYSESLRDIVALEAVRAGDAVYYVRRDPREPRDVGRSASVRTPPAGVALTRTATPPVGVQIVRPSAPLLPTVLALQGRPDAGSLTTEIMARLNQAHARVVIDLDGAELLDDTLGPVLRRAAAAARAAGGAVVLRATRAGTQRWLARHGLVAEGDVP